MPDDSGFPIRDDVPMIAVFRQAIYLTTSSTVLRLSLQTRPKVNSVESPVRELTYHSFVALSV